MKIRKKHKTKIQKFRLNLKKHGENTKVAIYIQIWYMVDMNRKNANGQRQKQFLQLCV